MAMTQPQPEQPPAEPAPPVPPGPARTPLVDRVTALEDRLTQLIIMHNAFAGDVARELGF